MRHIVPFFTLRGIRWIHRNGKLIILSRGLRTFASGVLGVLMALYLAELGFSLLQIGTVLSLGIASAAFYTFWVSLFSEKIGRVRLMLGLTFLRMVGWAALILSDSFPVIAVFAFLGTVAGYGSSEPIMPLEQASLPDTTSAARRTDLYSLYGVVATVAAALGALAAGLPGVIESLFSVARLPAYRILLAAVSLFTLLSGLCYLFLPPDFTSNSEKRRWVNPFKLPSRKIIFTLTGLFSIDAFGGSLVMPSLAAYWFVSRFGIDIRTLAFVFFTTHVLRAAGIWLSAKLAARIGLIRTMVFTHIPANLFLIGAAFAPSVGWAIAFWLCRSILITMDVPARESYTMTVVEPDERVAMASIHWLGRCGASAIGPSVSTAVWQALSASVPFIGSAVIKISYCLGLFALFRNVKPSGESMDPAAPTQDRDGDEGK